VRLTGHRLTPIDLVRFAALRLRNRFAPGLGPGRGSALVSIPGGR
jgi:hypothetical protein